MPKAILANGLPTQPGARHSDTQKIAAIYARVIPEALVTVRPANS